jgi:hypothetical protein
LTVAIQVNIDYITLFSYGELQIVAFLSHLVKVEGVCGCGQAPIIVEILGESFLDPIAVLAFVRLKGGMMMITMSTPISYLT